MPLRYITATVLVFALMLSGGCGLLPREEEEPPPILATPVKSEKEIFTVKRGSIVEKVSLRARFAPARYADLYYRVGGRVKAVHVRAGDRVTAGQVLVELDKEDLQYQLVQTEIKYQKAILNLEDLKYRSQFKGDNPLSENELKRAQLDLESVQLEREKLQKQLVESQLVAPFDGEVISLAVKPGDNLQNYAVVLTLADPKDLWIEADVDDAALAKVAVGQTVRLEFSDLGAEASHGKVVQLPEAQTTGTQPKRIHVRLDKPSEKARMGMVGKVHVILQEKQDVLLLPNAALRVYAGRNYVLLKEPRREIDVVLGIQGELETEVVSGLKEGDQVIGR